MPSRFPAVPHCDGTLIAAGIVLGSAVIALGGSALLASACTETLAQPDDAGPFTRYEGGHPPPSTYGSPCELGALPPERCCGEVAKEIRGDQCYGCTGTVAYALCVGGAFNCACTCESPLGYALLGADGGSSDCGVSETDGGLGDGPAETGAPETGPAEASSDAGDASLDATADVDAGATADAHDGG